MVISKDKLFHPVELAFCGYSGSGKTTLISKLISSMSDRYDIGYIKHDVHNFSMDKDGKDTWMAKHAGAKNIMINDQHRTAYIMDGGDQRYLTQLSMIDMDLIFIEGYKKSRTKKILVFGDDEKSKQILIDYQAGKYENVEALVGTFDPNLDIPYFHRDQVLQIEEFIKEKLFSHLIKRPIYGLVLVGGKSTRMKKDKGKIVYHDKPQVRYLYELLETVCDRTFVSVRSEQKNWPELEGLNLIEDQILEKGPSGGILSALNQNPDTAFLVLACDLPFVDRSMIEQLIKGRNSLKVATSFWNEQRSWPEPLCAIYEPKAAIKLGKYMALGRPCPRKVLMNSNIQIIKNIEQTFLENANTFEEYSQAQQVLAKR